MEVIKVKRPPRVATIRCKYCDLDYALKKDWKRHLHQVHGKDAFPCQVCPEVFYEHNDLQSHVQSAHGGRTRHYCTQCSNSYKQHKALTMHVDLMHKIEESTFCGLCDEQFHNTSAHKRHLQMHHGPQYVYHKCRKCVRSFRNKAHVMMHKEFDHSSDGKRNFLEYLKKRNLNYKILSDGYKKCDVCTVKFKYSIDMIKHLKVYHKKNNKFSCCQCDTVYSTRSSLGVHQRHDHGLLNHSCDICPPARKPSMAAPLTTEKPRAKDKKLPDGNRQKYARLEVDGKENHNMSSDKIYMSRAPWTLKIIRNNVPSNLDLKEANEEEVQNLRHNIKAAFTILSTIAPSRLKASVFPLQNTIKPRLVGRQVKALSLMYPSAHPFSNLPTYSFRRGTISSKVDTKVDDENTADNNSNEQCLADVTVNNDCSNEMSINDKFCNNNTNVTNDVVQETHQNLSIVVDLGVQKQTNISPNMHWKKRKLESSLVESKEREIQLASQEKHAEVVSNNLDVSLDQNSDSAQLMVDPSTSEPYTPTSEKEKITLKIPRVIVKDFSKEVQTKGVLDTRVMEPAEEITKEGDNMKPDKKGDNHNIGVKENHKKSNKEPLVQVSEPESVNESKDTIRVPRKRKIDKESQLTSNTESVSEKVTGEKVSASQSTKSHAKKLKIVLKQTNSNMEKIQIPQKDSDKTKPSKAFAKEIVTEKDVEDLVSEVLEISPTDKSQPGKKHKSTKRLKSRKTTRQIKTPTIQQDTSIPISESVKQNISSHQNNISPLQRKKSVSSSRDMEHHDALTSKIVCSIPEKSSGKKKISMSSIKKTLTNRSLKDQVELKSKTVTSTSVKSLPVGKNNTIPSIEKPLSKDILIYQEDLALQREDNILETRSKDKTKTSVSSPKKDERELTTKAVDSPSDKSSSIENKISMSSLRKPTIQGLKECQEPLVEKKTSLSSPEKTLSVDIMKGQKESTMKAIDSPSEKSSYIETKISMSSTNKKPTTEDVEEYQELKSNTVYSVHEKLSLVEKKTAASSVKKPSTKENINNQRDLASKPVDSIPSLAIKTKTSMSSMKKTSSTDNFKFYDDSALKAVDSDSENTLSVKTKISSINKSLSKENEQDRMELNLITVDSISVKSSTVENKKNTSPIKETLAKENIEDQEEKDSNITHPVQEKLSYIENETSFKGNVKVQENTASKPVVSVIHVSPKKGDEIKKIKAEKYCTISKTTEKYKKSKDADMIEQELVSSVSKGSHTRNKTLLTVKGQSVNVINKNVHKQKSATKEKQKRRQSSRTNIHEVDITKNIDLKNGEINKGLETQNQLFLSDTPTGNLKQNKEDFETNKLEKTKYLTEECDKSVEKEKKVEETLGGTINITEMESLKEEHPISEIKSVNSKRKKSKMVESKYVSENISQTHIKMNKQDKMKTSIIESVDGTNPRSTEFTVDNNDLSLVVGNEKNHKQSTGNVQQTEESVAGISDFLNSYSEAPNPSNQKPYQTSASIDLKKKLETFNKESVVQTSESDVENLLSLATDIVRPTQESTVNKVIISQKEKEKNDLVLPEIQVCPTNKDFFPIISSTPKVQSNRLTVLNNEAKDACVSINLNKSNEEVHGKIRRNISGHSRNDIIMQGIYTTGKANEIILIPNEKGKTVKHTNLSTEKLMAPNEIKPTINLPENVICISPKLFNFTAAQELGFLGSSAEKRYTPIRLVKMKPQNTSQLELKCSNSSTLQSAENEDIPTKNNETSVRIEGSKSDSLSLFKCSQCNAIFWLKSSLQNHERDVHHILLDCSLDQKAKQEQKEKAVKIILDRIDKVLVNRSELEKLGIRYTPLNDIKNQVETPKIPVVPEQNSAENEIYDTDQLSDLNEGISMQTVRVETPIPMELYTPRIDSPKPNSCEISQSMEVVKVRLDEQENDEICVLMEIENCVEIETTDNCVEDEIQDNYAEDETTGASITFNSALGIREEIIPKEYSCAFCSITLLDEVSLLDHLTEVHDKNTALTPERTFFKCVTCSAAFTQKDLHEKHVLETHIATNTFKCSKCSAEYFYKDHLKNHEKDMHGSGLENTHKTFQEAFENQIKLQSPQKDCTIVEIETPKKQVRFSDENVDLLISSHSEMKMYECGKCKKAFKNKLALYAHNKTEHVKKHVYKCRKCNADFKNKTNRDRHRCSTQMQFWCRACRICFQNKESLIEHKKQKHNMGSLKCDYCDRFFKKNHNLVKHVKLKHCTSEYNSLNVVKQNKRSKNKSTRRIPGDIYDDLEIINQAPEYATPVANETAQPPNTSSNDILNKFPVHKKNSTIAQNKTSSKSLGITKLTFKCNNGNKKLQKQKVDNIADITPRRLYKCLKCTAKFPNKVYLLKHIKAEHKLEPNRLHRCQLCSAVFKFEDKLSQHFKMKHSSAYSNDSQSGLQQKSALDSSKATKEQQKIENPVNKSTPDKPVATSHIIITPEMLRSAMFGCTQCGAFLPTNALLQRHVLMEHSQNTFVKCGQCGKILDKVNDLRKHMLLVHFTDNE